MKLTPAPKQCKPGYTWKDLDSYLQSVFSKFPCDPDETAIILIKNYEIDINEMKSELQNAGYLIVSETDDYITVKLSSPTI